MAEMFSNALPESPEQWITAALTLLIAVLGWWKQVKSKPGK